MKSENVVVGIYGFKGSGKTTTATLFMLFEHLYGCRKNLYSNYKLNFPFEWLKGKDLTELNAKLDDSACCIDEIGQYADSRNSNSRQNRNIASFFIQSRHTRSNVYFTTTFRDQVDKRIRRLCDIDIVSENLFIDSDRDGDDDIFQITITDHRVANGMIKQMKYYAKPVFDLFDSTEKINPFIFSEEEEKSWKKKVAKEIMVP